MTIALAVGSFFVLALLLPLVRHRIRTGEWAIVMHRAADPFQQFVGRAFGLALLGVALWTGAYAVWGPQSLHVVEAPAALERLGWALFAISLLLVVTAQATMGVSWRIGIDNRRTELVALGIYRWVRHPIYTGMMGLLLALVLLAPSPWTLLALPLVALPIGVQARLEEIHLERLHGDAWRAYAARSGRFLPRLWRTA